MISADALISEVEGLTPSDRVRRVIEVARGLAPERRAELLAELGGGDRYTRQLAVTMAAASGDTAHLAVALRDPYPQVRAQAIAAAGLPDEAVTGFVADAPLAARLALYNRLRRGRRTALADRLLAQVRERWGDGEAARLLAACSPSTVREVLAELAYAVTGWSMLTARHPEIVVRHVDAELEALGAEARVAWWGRSGALVSALARHRPADLLDLWERRLPGPLPVADRRVLTRLLGVDPARMVRLLLADPARVRSLAYWVPGRSARDRLAMVPDGDLGALLRAAGPHSAFTVSALRGLPPSRRAAVFDLACAGRDLTTELMPDAILRLLPHGRRHAEARRMLALPAVADDHTMTWRITAFLPWAQARPVLIEATRGADADDRAHAYEALVLCASMAARRAAPATDTAPATHAADPAVVAELLADLGRIRNERDPVRSPILTALAAYVRPELYDAGSVPALDELVRGAIDARDCSWQTRNAVQKLVFGVLAHAATTNDAATAGSADSVYSAGAVRPLLDWALDTVERLAAWEHSALSGAAWRGLRRGQEREVLTRLGPWLAKALDGGRAHPVLDVAQALGRRAWELPELQDLVCRATRIKDDGVVRRAVGLWLAPRAGRRERAGQLVAWDESMVVLPQVLAVVVRGRTDLLDELVLSGRRLRGRFGTSRARWVPVIERAEVLRWTPGQIRRYADLLGQAVGGRGPDRVNRAAFVRALAALPDSTPDTVSRWLDGDDVLLAEAGLAGLAHSDRPDRALPVLLDHVHGDRARVAVYAASRCARELAPSLLGGILSGVLATAPKVSARKEAARLLSVTRPAGAVEALLAAWHRDGQHRDVRAAVATALRGWLDDERVWPVLDAAAEGERAVAESLLAMQPDMIAARHRRRYASLVLRLTRHPEPLVARAAYSTLAQPSWMLGGSDDLADDLARGVTDLTSGPTWRQAAMAVLTPAVWTAVPDLLPGIATTLISATRADPDPDPDAESGAKPSAERDAEPDAERLRDLPARQRLDRLVAGLSGQADAVRRHPEPVRRVAAILAADPSFVPAAARLQAVLAWPGPHFTDQLLAIADLLRDLPVTAATIDEHLAVDEWEADDVAAGVDALSTRGDRASGLIAVQLVAAMGGITGWPDSWRARLRALRRHPEPEVCHAARAVFTADE